ncbi:tRNA (adenosine(37)-N6)-dimethylallyltransferase MiaA [Roseicyclus sp.]|uniref:tRNA (adenosine(37)-N6)-dimethylallyltransferase MiaA n=1 Tax=Roseicyclus sp. TaxID=1914329 RepID=UPI003F697528
MSQSNALIDLNTIPADRPVLIAGPTASGKSALALRIAQAQGGIIVNADALQVYKNWCVLTARPDAADLAAAPHRLYGHVAWDAAYSVGHWLREVAALMAGPRLIIVGGTGLYFRALTEGLADIPATPAAIRTKADALSLTEMIATLDPATAKGIDLNNRARVQRAWEVLQATGRGLAAWQADTPAPLLPLASCTALRMDAPVEWLNTRIARRFDMMLDRGALAEAEANWPRWNPNLPAMKAIGAQELISHLHGELTLAQARDAAIIASRQYAKRQRTWFRARMGDWRGIDPS